MIHRVVFHNDRLLPVEEVRLSPGQSGLMSGWGLFTTMRVVEGNSICVRAPLEAPLARRRSERIARFRFPQETVHGQLSEVLRANQVQRRLRANLRDLQPDRLLAQRREFARGGSGDLLGRFAAAPRAGAPGAARAWTPCGVAAGGREGHFVAQQRVESLRGAAGRLRRSGAAQRARRSGGMHGREYFLRARRARADAAAFVRLPGRRDARRRARDRRGRGRAGGGADAAAGGSLFGGWSVHFLDESELDRGRAKSTGTRSRRRRCRRCRSWKRAFQLTCASMWMRE